MEDGMFMKKKIQGLAKRIAYIKLFLEAVQPFSLKLFKRKPYNRVIFLLFSSYLPGAVQPSLPISSYLLEAVQPFFIKLFNGSCTTVLFFVLKLFTGAVQPFTI
jgi:hypothetical protein